MKYSLEELRELEHLLFSLSAKPGNSDYWNMGKMIDEFLVENPNPRSDPTLRDFELYKRPAFYSALFVKKLEDLPLMVNNDGLNTDRMGPVARWRLEIGK